MEYIEEVTKEAEGIVEKYEKIGLITKWNPIYCAIQDRQSVLDALDSLYPKGGCNCDVILDRLIQSLTQQIEYLKTKI